MLQLLNQDREAVGSLPTASQSKPLNQTFLELIMGLFRSLGNFAAEKAKEAVRNQVDGAKQAVKNKVKEEIKTMWRELVDGSDGKNTGNRK